MTTINIELLRGLPFLKEVSADVVEVLAKAAKERTFRPGQVIFQEGSTSRELFLIVDGMVEVVKGQGADEMVLARRTQGDFFGEMGLIEASPRFATIRTLEPTRLLEFSEENCGLYCFGSLCCCMGWCRSLALGCAAPTCR